MAKDLNWIMRKVLEEVFEIRRSLEEFDKYPEEGMELCHCSKRARVLLADFEKEAKKRLGKAIKEKERYKKVEAIYQQSKRKQWAFSMGEKRGYEPTVDGTW